MCCFTISLVVLCSRTTGQSAEWQRIDEGLFLGEFSSTKKSIVADSKITILKISPKHYSLKLICASENKNARRTAKEWCRTESLVAAVNASMFAADGITSTGLMKNFDHINNKTLSDYNAILAFNPAENHLPDVTIIDRKCEGFDVSETKYQTLIQNIRMISCQGGNVWAQQKKQWSMVLLALDKMDNILFIFTRSPYSVHDFINILLSLPISISRTMYLEGGPEASLYVSRNGVELEKFGSYETGFNENDDNNAAWPIPNVIGIVRK